MNIEAESHTILRGRRLTWARIAWVMVALVLLGAVLASWPPYVRLLLTVCETCEMTPAYAKSLDATGFSPAMWAMFLIIPSIIVYLGWMGIGMLIFLLKANDRRALLLSILLIVVGASFGGTIGQVAQYLPQWLWVSKLVNTVSFPAMVALIYLFPNGVFNPRWLVWLLGIQTLLFLPIQFENLGLPIANNFIIILSTVITCIAVPLYRYRRVMTFTERQQMKWVVFGIVLAMAGIATTLMLVATGPVPCDSRNLYCDVVQNVGYSFSPLMIPIFIGIAILRSRLWDIDIIIRRTLQYTVLTLLLGLVYFGSIVVLQTLVGQAVGEQSPLIIVFSTLLIAALFNPVRGRVQNVIDGRFYRKKYNAQQALAQFAQTARDEVEMEKLTAALLTIVQETLQPEEIFLWFKPEEQKK